MYPEVEPIFAAAAPSGLRASAIKPDTSGERWEQGFSWRSERCLNVQGYSICAELVSEPAANADGIVNYYTPQAFRLRDECSTIGGVLDGERIRRQAEAVTGSVMAAELWTGALTVANPATIDGDPHTNARLAMASADTIVTTGTIAERLAKLEEEALERSLGQTVYLHVPVHMVTPIAERLSSVGPVLYTALGSVVVADGGYPGTGPAGTGTTWAYATGPVQVRLSNIVVEAAPRETINRTTNRQEVWADRVFAASFDPCLHLATDVGA